MKIKRILCPTDFSASAEKAVEYAVFLASSHNAELQLLHVVDHLHGFDNYLILSMTPDEISERMEEHTNENLSEVVNQIKETVKIQKAVRHGKASVQIVEMAKEMKADLVVMGTHGRTGLSHVIIGSVAEAVIRHAHCPVLVVRDIDQ
jgi:universal stress protein A